MRFSYCYSTIIVFSYSLSFYPMTDITQLIQDRAALDAQIQAQKPLAVARVMALMGELGLTWSDFGVTPAGSANPAVKRAVKYRDADGHTWTGVGQRPRWLKHALDQGAALESFRVKV